MILLKKVTPRLKITLFAKVTLRLKITFRAKVSLFKNVFVQKCSFVQKSLRAYLTLHAKISSCILDPCNNKYIIAVSGKHHKATIRDFLRPHFANCL